LCWNQTKHGNLTFQTVTVIWRRVGSVRPHLSHKLEVLIKLSTALLMECCGRSSQSVWKTFFSSSMVLGLGWNAFKCLVAFKHSSPIMIIKRIKVWWVRWFFSDEVTAVDGNPVFSQLRRMSRAGAPSCWKMKLDCKSDLQSSTNLDSKISQWSLPLTFALSGVKCSLPFRHSTHQQRPWRAWQISPFPLPGAFCRRLASCQRTKHDHFDG